MHANVNIQFPEEILLVLRKNKDEFAAEMKRTISVKYFQEKNSQAVFEEVRLPVTFICIR